MKTKIMLNADNTLHFVFWRKKHVLHKEKDTFVGFRI